MDETVYQCPECNFNADNLIELDGHIIEFHSNESRNADKNNLISHEDDDEGDGGGDDIINQTNNQEDDDILIDNEIPHQNNSSNQNFTTNNTEDENELFNDDYYYENNTNNYDGNKKKEQIQNRLPIVTNNKAHNLRQKQPIDYNDLNGTSSVDVPSSFSMPTATATTNNRRSAASSIPPTPISAVNPNVPIINSDNHYERQYTCKRCGFFTNNPRAVLYHRKEFHFEKINIHECTYCQYASQYSGKVERHTLLRHKIDINSSPSKKLMNQKLKADYMNKTMDNSSLNLTELGNMDTTVLNNTTITNRTSLTNNTLNANNKANVMNPSLNASLKQADLENKSSQQNKTIESTSQFSNNIAKFQCNKCPCKYKRSNDLYKHLKLKHGVLAQRLSDYLTTTPVAMSNSAQTNVNNDGIDEEMLEDNQYADETEITQDLFNEEETDENKTNQYHKQNTVQETQNSNSYECPYCTYYSNGNDAEYLLHVKDHLCGKSFRCVLCNSVYKYRGDCVVHLKRKHQKADLYAQNYVERFNLDSLDISQICILLKPKQQEETENEEKLFSCSYCDYKANYKGDVFKHQTRRHPGSPKNVTSLNPHLNMSGSENTSLVNRHPRSNLVQPTVLFNGDNQNNITNNLNNNNYTNDNPDNDNEVIELDTNYPNNDYYYNNSQINESNNIQSVNDQYIEDEQDNEYNEEENLFNDEEIIEEQQGYDANNYDDQNELEVINEFVDQDYAYNDNNDVSTIDQIKNDETNEIANETLSRFQCKFCSFIGKNHAKLQLHLATHYNLKPFVCPICNRRANFKWDIQKHLRKIHNDYVSEVICLSETEARQSISSYIEGKQPITFDSGSNNLVVNNARAAPVELNKRPASSLSSLSNNSFNSTNKFSSTQINRSNLIPANVNEFDEENKESFDDQLIDEEQDLNNSSLANLRLLARKRTQHALRERKFKCSLCNRTSKWQWDIRKHLRTVHRGQSGGDVIILREIETPKKTNPTLNSSLNVQNKQIGHNTNNFMHNRPKIPIAINGLIRNPVNQTQNNVFNNRPNLNTSNGNASLNQQRNRFLNSHQPQQQSLLQQSQTFSKSQPITASPVIATCSDPTGNKKFKCTVCPYRSNWKADLFRHLKKRHFVQQPQLENVVILDSEYAASSLEEYEQVHGIHVRKRSRTDLDSFNCTINTNMSDCSMLTSNETKKAKLNSDEQLNGTGDDEMDERNQLQQQENNIEFLNRSNRLPVSIAELNIKPYKCLKCGFRSDRKSDTLRHIRVKHSQTVNAVKFLRIMSIKEASDTIENYENMRLYKKIKNFNSDNTPNIYEEALNQYDSENNNEANFLMIDSPPANNSLNGKESFTNKSLQTNQVTKNKIDNIPNNFDVINEKQEDSTHAKCCDFYRCPFCSFKNVSKLIMRRHLVIHFSNQKVKINPVYRCNICSFKSKWKFSVKKHILMSHSTQNAYVLKVVNKNEVSKLDSKSKIKTSINLLNGGHEHDQIDDHLDENTSPINEVISDYHEDSDNETKPEKSTLEQDKTKSLDNHVNDYYNENLNNTANNELDEEDEVDEDYDSNGYSFQNNETIKTENESFLPNDDGEKTAETIVLTGYDGTQFQASFLVSNPLHHSIGNQNGAKKKVYYCQTCPYKTSNYSNLRQHLLQHRYQEGYFQCRYCVYYVSKVRLLKQHEILHPEFELRLTAKQIKQQKSAVV